MSGEQTPAVDVDVARPIAVSCSDPPPAGARRGCGGSAAGTCWAVFFFPNIQGPRGVFSEWALEGGRGGGRVCVRDRAKVHAAPSWSRSQTYETFWDFFRPFFLESGAFLSCPAQLDAECATK